MKKVIGSVLVAGIAGCATPTTGVVPLGEDLYTVAHQGNGAWVQTSELKATALQEAGAHCEKRQRSLKVLNVKEIPARPFGGWPEAEVLFKCL